MIKCAIIWRRHPVPVALDIHDVNAADTWQLFLNVWTNYTLSTEFYSKP